MGVEEGPSCMFKHYTCYAIPHFITRWRLTLMEIDSLSDI